MLVRIHLIGKLLFRLRCLIRTRSLLYESKDLLFGNLHAAPPAGGHLFVAPQPTRRDAPTAL